MKTIEELTAELYAHGEHAEIHALTLIRCLDYDYELAIDNEAYRLAVRAILNAMERARELRMADNRARLESMKAERRA